MRWPAAFLLWPRPRKKGFALTARTGCPAEISRPEDTIAALEQYGRMVVAKGKPRVVR